ncbi:hypothetical protein quinque_000015, partial [Culex quinquefasciatus]
GAISKLEQASGRADTGTGSS